MPSAPRTKLIARLTDFDELVRARDAICAPGAGRPAARRGASVIRGAVVLLAASFEAYVEEVFDVTVDAIYAATPAGERNALKNDTSAKLNNASVFKVNRLFFFVGVPWIMQNPRVRWQKFNNDRVRETLGELVTARNEIAHGEATSVRKQVAVKWKSFVEKLADRFDGILHDHIEERTGAAPW